MIKTLQITSILAVILAVILLVSSVVFGVQKDERIEKFLDSPSVKELFAKVAEGVVKGKVGQSSPLVDKAQRFASIINLEVNKPKVPLTRKQIPAIVRPEVVTPKFPLIGTCFCESNPEQSLAFINEPGKGLHWVRQGSSVGHLVIEQIKDGIIVIRDGQRTFEMLVEQEPITTSLIEGAQPAPAAGARSNTRPAVFSRKAPGNVPPRPITPRRPPPSVKGGSARMEALEARLKTAKKASASPPNRSAAGKNEVLEMFKKLMAERVDAEEAENLGKLGKNLDGNQQDPNRPKGGSKVQPTLPKPTLPKPTPPKPTPPKPRPSRPVRK